MKINSFNKIFLGCACVLVSGAIYSAVAPLPYVKKDNLKSIEYVQTVESHNTPQPYSENKCYLELHLDMVGVPFVLGSDNSKKVENGACIFKSAQKSIRS